MALLRQETIAGRGRGLIATRGLRAGEVLLRESPLLFYEEAEAAESASFCSHCLRLLSHRQTVSCSACNAATFCSTSCLDSGSHSSRTCNGISALKKEHHDFSLEEQTLARFLITAYNLNSKSIAKLLELEGQEQDEDVVKKLHAFVVETLPSDVEPTLKMTGEFLARDACNTFGLMAPSKPGEERKVRGYAMYAQASMFNHDCLPNACRFEYVDRDRDGNTDVIVRALHDIEEGTEVCLSYFPVDWAYGDRQKKLQEEYGFWCKCARCKVESEWKDDESEEELELESSEVKEDVEEEEEEEDDFGHAMFFVKYLCPVEECGGTMAPLPPGELDAQRLEGSMECNFCGHVRSDEEFHRDLEEHAVDDD